MTYEARVVRIGSAPDREAVLTAPQVAAKHANIEFAPEECQFHLKRRDGQVFVNGNEVEEVILQDGDQIELGSGGPMLRFRIYVPIGAVCKPVRRMLADARDVARVSGGAAATRTLTRDLFKHATPRLKIGFPVAVVAGGFLAGWLGGWIGVGAPEVTRADIEQLVPPPEQRVTMADLDRLREEQRRQQADLERLTRSEIEALRQEQQQRQPVDTVTRSDLEALRREQQKQQEDLARLARANAVVRRIQKDLTSGVCLLHGVFRLRLPDGSWFEPDGSPYEVEYTGSGFLAADTGHVITNRHVVAPWEEMAQVMRLVERGVTPEFARLTATFPGRAPIDVPVESITRRADDLDVAVLKLPQEKLAGVPILPLHQGPIEGDDQRAIVVGYPTGLAVLLARADAELVDGLRQRGAGMADVITELASHGQITPTITQGVISNQQERMLVYDAPTTHGGSGGPVFGGDGEVIAVNFAIHPDFPGTNFGVPIRFAQELLPR